MAAGWGGCLGAADPSGDDVEHQSGAYTDAHVTNWPEYVRMQVIVPVVDTVCDRTFQVYVTLENLRCDSEEFPPITSWELFLKPIGSNDAAYRLVLDPLHLDENDACTVHYVSRSWYAPHSWATADDYSLSLQGLTGLSTVRFSAFNPEPDLGVSFDQGQDGDPSVVHVSGLITPPQTGAFSDFVTVRTLSAQMQVQEGLMRNWETLDALPSTAKAIASFQTHDALETIPLSVRLEARYKVNSVIRDKIPGEDDYKSRISVEVVRDSDRLFDVSSVDCSEN